VFYKAENIEKVIALHINVTAEKINSILLGKNIMKTTKS
jgi:hypothetical protein